MEDLSNVLSRVEANAWADSIYSFCQRWNQIYEYRNCVLTFCLLYLITEEKHTTYNSIKKKGSLASYLNVSNYKILSSLFQEAENGPRQLIISPSSFPWQKTCLRET